MCKFGFNFFAIIFQFALCKGKNRIVLGQSGLNQNSQRYNEFYFFKSNLTHKLQCCL